MNNTSAAHAPYSTNMKRKAQVKMFETIAVLVVFFFLLIFGVSFYFVLQRSSYNKQVERNAQSNAIKISLQLSDIPELDCALTGVTIDNCIDTEKLGIMQQLLQDPETFQDYFPIFGYSSINITTLAIGQERQSFTLYANQPSTFRSAYKNFVPILLYDPVANAYTFGVLEAVIYVE